MSLAEKKLKLKRVQRCNKIHPDYFLRSEAVCHCGFCSSNTSQSLGRSQPLTLFCSCFLSCCILPSWLASSCMIWLLRPGGELVSRKNSDLRLGKAGRNEVALGRCTRLSIRRVLPGGGISSLSAKCAGLCKCIRSATRQRSGSGLSSTGTKALRSFPDQDEIIQTR